MFIFETGDNPERIMIDHEVWEGEEVLKRNADLLDPSITRTAADVYRLAESIPTLEFRAFLKGEIDSPVLPPSSLL